MAGACNILNHTTQEASPFVLNLTHISFACCLWHLLRDILKQFTFSICAHYIHCSILSFQGVNPALFNYLLVQNCFHTFFFFIILHCTFCNSIYSWKRWRGDRTIQVTGFCRSVCFVFYSPHNHSQYSVSWTTIEHRGTVFMELPLIIQRLFFLNGNRIFKNSLPLT